MKLSILICSLRTRRQTLLNLLEALLRQAGTHTINVIRGRNFTLEFYVRDHVEIIVCIDDKKMSVGNKRNQLIQEADGEYIAFVDDDDMVTHDYVSSLLQAIKHAPDVVVFDVDRWHNGEPDKPVSYGIEYKRDQNLRNRYLRIPNHLMCVKKSLALQVPFKHVSFGEDSDYAQRLLPLLKKQHRIDKTLYRYLFNDQLTETAK